MRGYLQINIKNRDNESTMVATLPDVNLKQKASRVVCDRNKYYDLDKISTLTKCSSLEVWLEHSSNFVYTIYQIFIITC